MRICSRCSRGRNMMPSRSVGTAILFIYFYLFILLNYKMIMIMIMIIIIIIIIIIMDLIRNTNNVDFKRTRYFSSWKNYYYYYLFIYFGEIIKIFRHKNA